MSLRKAINAKCKQCVYDAMDVGTAAQQIAACICRDCPLHKVRPITTKQLPVSLLEAYNVNPMELDEIARGLVYPSATSAGDSQIGRPLTAASKELTNPEFLGEKVETPS